MDWASSIVEGKETWTDSPLQLVGRRRHQVLREHWRGSTRCWRVARRARPPRRRRGTTRLFQGPIADALTHVGQLAMMRRLAGAPMRGQNYSRADIVAGRVGLDQTAPKREF